jgi:enoyl-CoA hydratase
VSPEITECPDSLLVEYRVAGPVAVLTLANPPVNVVSRPLTRDFGTQLDRAAGDPDVRAVVVAAAGEHAFCAGSDIREFPAIHEPGQAVTHKLRPQKDVFGRLAHLPKPTVAAVQALCYGGGLEIAVCCDMIVTEAHVTFASPEITLGLFPSSGGTLRTTRRIGTGRAKELMLGAQPIDAATALSWGLVNRVVGRGEGLDAAIAWATELAARPAIGVSTCKAAIELAFDRSEEEALEETLALSDRAFSSPEAREGYESFFAKRAPDYTAIPYPAPESREG